MNLTEEVKLKQKELLEHTILKTIDSMIKEKSLNVIAIIDQAYQKGAFFPDLYEMFFLKMITQYPINNCVKIALKYEKFGLLPLKASELFNEGIKYTDSLDLDNMFTSFQTNRLVKELNASYLFFDTENIEKIKKSLNAYNDKDDVLQMNEKIKSYVTLNDRLELKGIKTKIGKI